MRICILNDHTWDCNFSPELYLKDHRCERIDIFYKKSHEILKKIQNNFDLFLNFCDASLVEKRPGLDVVLALEKLGLPFTGAYSFCYEPSRNKMKTICENKNISMPKAINIGDINKVSNDIFRYFKYPLIVKHSNSFGSIGLTKNSKVYNLDQLKVEIEKMLKITKVARIEEFIEGKEFSCLISQNPKNINDPIAYEPIEINFPEGESFKHTEMKWINYKQMDCKQVEDKNISEQIKNISKELFKGINGRGYGRCDIRMDENNNLFILEINSQAGILLPPDEPSTADIILKLENKHEYFVDLLIKSAFANTSLINYRV
jgi:D-alanine-D-alanine ligase